MAFVWLKSKANTDFVCAEGGGGGNLVANRDYILEWESFQFGDTTGSASELRIGDHITLRATNGLYVCAELGQEYSPQHPLKANRSVANAWETFRIVPIPGYSETWNHLIDNEPRPLDPGSRKPVGTPCALQTWAGSYVSCRLNGGMQLTAEVYEINAWEQFEIGFAGGNVFRPSYAVWRDKVASIA
jgi:hypothetical protein